MEVKNSRDNSAVKTSLAELKAAAEGKGNLLEYSVKAARHRATLGEISSTLEEVFGRYVPSGTVVSGAYTSIVNDGFDKIIERTKQFEAKAGRRHRIIIIKMGQDGHDRGSQVVASALSDLGFDVDIGPLF